MPKDDDAGVCHPLGVDHDARDPRPNQLAVGLVGAVVAVEYLVADARPRHAGVRRVARKLLGSVALLLAVRSVAGEHVDAAELVRAVRAVRPPVADQRRRDAAARHFAAELVGQTLLQEITVFLCDKLHNGIKLERPRRLQKP